MIVVEPRGTHLVDCGVVRRWEQVNLDIAFRSYWAKDDKYSRYEPFNFIEARPDSPHPYCVYERFEPLEKGHSVGRDFYEEFQYEDVTIQFRVHAKPAGNTDAKTVCETLGMLIKRAFDPGTPLLDMSPDGHSATISEGDWVVREGDQEYFYVVQYLLRVEGTYGRAETNELPSYIDLTIPGPGGVIPTSQP